MLENNLATIANLKFVEKLKLDTAKAHKELESLDVSKSIIAPSVTKEQYVYYLNLMEDIISEIETEVFPLLKNIVPDLDERRKIENIHEDFAYLQFKKIKRQSVFKDATRTIPFALGMMYVVEGSVLGGRLILKNVSCLCINAENGAKYFAGYGNQTGKYWAAFLNLLSDYEQKNQCSKEIIAGAEFAFKSIYNHFLSIPKNEI